MFPSPPVPRWPTRMESAIKKGGRVRVEAGAERGRKKKKKRVEKRSNIIEEKAVDLVGNRGRMECSWPRRS